MKTFKVNSLPLKEVIESLAQSFEVEVQENCGEFFLTIPPQFGKGQIRAIMFDNGLGIIIYKCQFLENICIEFNVDEVHPVKYIYSVKGTIDHSFKNEQTVHHIEEYKCAIVASEKNNGHILSFKKDTDIEILSLEIDREKFLVNTACEVDSLTSPLKKLFRDTKALENFYHDGFYGLEFQQLLSTNLLYKDHALARKFYLESISLQIFVNQLVQFEDDLLNKKSQTILRVNEIKRIEELANYIKSNLSKDLTIVELSQIAGFNQNKLQKGFKYLFNSTINEYVMKMRLEKALILLKNPELNISDVAFSLGIESNSYLSKIFKTKFGLTPSEYKKL